jgi:uncharacterized protein involved in exopolysaccharide biosynthesis
MMSEGDSVVNFGSMTAWKRAATIVSTAVRRRWVSIAVLASIFVLVGGTAGMLLPRMYSAQASLLIKKNYVMAALADPKRAVPSVFDPPTQSAAESVLSRQSLEGIVRRNNLIVAWDADRPKLLRFKDRITGMLRGPIPDSEKLDVLIDLLNKRITVSTQDDGVTVKAIWTKPETARDLVNSAMSAFLESRRMHDVQEIAETYTILKSAADLEKSKVEQQLVAVNEADRAAKLVRAVRPVSFKLTPSEMQPKNDGLEELRSQIQAARANKLDVEKRHRDKITEVEARLAERRAAATDRHPDVVGLQESLARLRQVPENVIAARAEENRLLADYAAQGGSLDRLASISSEAARLAQTVRPTLAAPNARPALKEEEDDATVYARSLFKGSLATYQDLLERLRNVEIELQTAEVSFGYRYTITSPARLPKKADSPNVPVIVIGALVTGALAGAIRAIFKSLQAQSLLSPSALMAHLSAPPSAPAAS